MKSLGLSQRFITESSIYAGLSLGRVISQSKDLYKVITERRSSGRNLRQAAVCGSFAADYLAVGDFVMLDRDDDAGGNAIIHHILTRKSAFIRKAAGTANAEQIVVANIDTVFICMSLNNDYNLRRVERYLGIAWDSGAIPVIVLTKADLCDDVNEKLQELIQLPVVLKCLLPQA